MTTKYDSGKSAGFISTANVPVPGFGTTTRMKIYVPKNIRVLVGDITELVQKPGSSSSTQSKPYDKVFEFILPRSTIINFVAEDKKGVEYYTILSGDEILDKKIQNKILSDSLISEY